MYRNFENTETPPPAYEDRQELPPVKLAQFISNQPSETTTVNVVAVQSQPEKFGPMPTMTTCPSCHAQVLTKVDISPSTTTHLFAVALCALGGCLCAWLPYVIDSCQRRNHLCPECNAYLGTFKDM